MDSVTLLSIAGTIISICFGVIGFLMTRAISDNDRRITENQKVAEKDINSVQQKFSDDSLALWRKHDEDAAALANFRLEIAQRHYEKSELDDRFEKFERIFMGRFDGLERKIEEFSRLCLQHLRDNGNPSANRQQ